VSTTYDLNLERRPATTRTWVALGAAATAVAVLVMIIAVACTGAGGAPLAAGSPGPDTSAGPAAEDTDTGDHPGQSSTGAGGLGGHGGGTDAPGGDDPGGEDPGGDDPGGDDPGEVHPVFPIPLAPILSAEVYEPLPQAPCIGRGTIFVEGIVLAPIEVEYQWIRIGQLGLANEPLTGKMTVVFDKPGYKHVPALFPDSDVERAVQLHIYGADTVYSNPVAYPACP
jgi:hypothetical protein